MTASILSQTLLHLFIMSHIIGQVARSAEAPISKGWPKTSKEKTTTWTIHVVNVVDAVISLPTSSFRNKGLISSAGRSVAGRKPLVLSPFRDYPSCRKTTFPKVRPPSLWNKFNDFLTDVRSHLQNSLQGCLRLPLKLHYNLTTPFAGSCFFPLLSTAVGLQSTP